MLVGGGLTLTVLAEVVAQAGVDALLPVRLVRAVTKVLPRELIGLHDGGQPLHDPSRGPWGAVVVIGCGMVDGGGSAFSTLAILLPPTTTLSLLGGVVAVPSSPLSYDAELAAQLWNASADIAGVPREPQVGAAAGSGGVASVNKASR